MRFLIDADLPRRAVALIRSHGHEAIDVRDVSPAIPFDAQIADYARRESFCLITCDWGFGDIRNYPPADYHGIVVLELAEHATADDKLKLIELLLDQPQVVASLPHRLAIVSRSRIRLRPA